MGAQSDLFCVPVRLRRGAYDLRKFLPVCLSTCLLGVSDGAREAHGRKVVEGTVWKRV